MISERTVDKTEKKIITLKSTGHKVSVCLAVKANGTKLKPIVVFKGLHHREIIANSANEWMIIELTKVWVDSVVGAFAFNRRLLACDSYECLIKDTITESLKFKNIDSIIVPCGCTKYIQEQDVRWNKPFKVSCTEKYDEWLEAVGIHEATAA